MYVLYVSVFVVIFKITKKRQSIQYDAIAFQQTHNSLSAEIPLLLNISQENSVLFISFLFCVNSYKHWSSCDGMHTFVYYGFRLYLKFIWSYERNWNYEKTILKSSCLYVIFEKKITIDFGMLTYFPLFRFVSSVLFLLYSKMLHVATNYVNMLI